jgi:hypothetical protein
VIEVRPKHPISGWDASLQKIAEIVSESGNFHEAAYRLYNHQASNNHLAVDWWLNPQEKSVEIFETIINADEPFALEIDEEQLESFVDAVVSLQEHIEGGKNLASFLEKFEIDRPPPKTDNIVIRRKPQRVAEEAIGKPQSSTVGEITLREIEDEKEDSIDEPEEK